MECSDQVKFLVPKSANYQGFDDDTYKLMEVIPFLIYFGIEIMHLLRFILESDLNFFAS